MKQRTTTSRKRDHVQLTMKKDVSFKKKTSGFEEWEFVHNALPEINLSDVDTATMFLGKKLSFPFLISCMTGGYPEAETINRQLAEVCEEYQIAMGVGSQRQAIENKTYHRSFSIVRSAAPSIPIIGNIGAPEVAALKDISSIQKLADLIGADAFAVHCNPLQEFLQPEGNTNFRGVLNGIEKLVKGLSIPVIVKEIGAGISFDVAQRLTDIGVRTIDIAGAGGTSWAGVEILRRIDNKEIDWNPFWDWGIRTTDALQEVVPLKKNIHPKLTIISSGGISNGIECAKSIALGADMTASARPMLKALMSNGKKGLRITIEQLMLECKGAMFLIGVPSIEKLQFSKNLIRKK
ncbi:MAG TPA: type 2 isopentenyl-diphosphate Delta-isomerase [Bacteroidetes bacterium]|nr:type 2 isopentenyl-diphosphate Delta-isomerase [Bacteroidota bacterium]